ncbi:MAG: SRPBCC family protein [Bryobacterales bacterium]|nr:SRPBCC family protein [Bryobacterales bacterium]
MSDYVLRCEMFAPVPVEEAFAVFQNPYNLAAITPPWLGFKVLRDDLTMRKGLEIDYTIRWMGIGMRWKTLITDYNPPYFFIDEQARGPYSMWRHKHTFESVAGGTKVSDEVVYRLPLGPLGDIAHWAMVDRQLRQIFGYRQKTLPGLIGGDRLGYRMSPVEIARATAGVPAWA